MPLGYTYYTQPPQLEARGPRYTSSNKSWAGYKTELIYTLAKHKVCAHTHGNKQHNVFVKKVGVQSLGEIDSFNMCDCERTPEDMV